MEKAIFNNPTMLSVLQKIFRSIHPRYPKIRKRLWATLHYIMFVMINHAITIKVISYLYYYLFYDINLFLKRDFGKREDHKTCADTTWPVMYVPFKSTITFVQLSIYFNVSVYFTLDTSIEREEGAFYMNIFNYIGISSFS